MFYLALALFLVNFALGELVQLRVVDTEPFRWLHHAIFFVVCVATALAAAWGLWRGEVYGWLLLPVLALFYVLPKVRAGTTGHATLASAALAFYAAGLLTVL